MCTNRLVSLREYASQAPIVRAQEPNAERLRRFAGQRQRQRASSTSKMKKKKKILKTSLKKH